MPTRYLMPTNFHQETVFSDGSDYFTALLEDIEQAKAQIDLETYTFNKDTLGKKLATALIQAAERGVQIRILVDGAGSPFWGGSFTRQLERAGIQTKIFHPYPWGLWQWSRSVVRLPSALKLIYLLLKINSRNHRKTCIIDKKTAYIGSLNIDQRHLHINDGGHGWRDMGVRLIDLPLDDLLFAFEASWNHRSPPKPWKTLFQQINTQASIRLNNTRHRRRVLYKNLLRRIAKCKQRLWITNAYFIPDTFLLKKLKDAAGNGADVRILLPRHSDVTIMPWASTTFYSHLMKAGVRIFEYLPSMLHAKTVVIDDWTLVGTSNLNHRSLLHDLEVDVNLYSAHAREKVIQQFHCDLEHAKEVTNNPWEDRPLHQRVVGNLLLYVKYLF